MGRGGGYGGVLVLVALGAGVLATGCRREEVSREDLLALQDSYSERALSETVRVYTDVPRVAGRVGGEWVGAINNDPQSFNRVIAHQDPDSRVVVGALYDFLVDYDVHRREWVPHVADFEIINDTEGDTTEVIFTLRDDLYWTLPDQDISDGVAVTAADVVFWYNRIDGEPALQQNGYSSQFVTMPDGSEARITVEQLDERRVLFRYPRVVANPLLSSNMTFGPRYIYEAALEAGGLEAVRNLFTVDTDVRSIPSMGTHHIAEYTPGVRVVLERNPHYWKRDEGGVSYPYIERIIMKIIPDINAEFLLFKRGEKDSHTARPEDLSELIEQEGVDYTVYNGGTALGSALIGFNQNPNAVSPHIQRWFSQKYFRQAMSSLLNRERVAQQVYRGLAEPAYHFFARPNPYYNEDIALEYRYDQRRALRLLRRIGIRPDREGRMRDREGEHIEFDLIVGIENNVGVDTANVFADELKQVGITVNVRPSDFQKMVDSLLTTYDWEAALFGLGANFWPSSGANVWPSGGNLHFWYPLQEEPHTEWEARIDTLYNEGKFTSDSEQAQRIYDEYQTILLEELPLLYIVHPYSFLAVRDSWENVRYDTLNGLESIYLFVK